MKTIMNISRQKTIMRAIRWMATDATLGATFGGLNGLIFSGFGALLHGESWRLVSIAGYFALCGAVAGAMVGACGAILNSGEKTPESTHIVREGTGEKQAPLEPGRHLLVPSQRQSQKSLVADSSSDRRRMLTATTKHPLSC
jgi:hypothetical protein